MSSRHKKVNIYENTVTVTAMNGSMKSISHVVYHLGKENHRIYGSFTVVQPEGMSTQDVKFHIISDIQFANWALPFIGHRPIGETYREIGDPKEYYYSSGRQKKADFDISITADVHLFFLLDNYFAQARSKTVKVTIWEEWDETLSKIDLVTTVPPQDRSLSEDIKKIISSAKNSLKIITPYIDMLLVSELLDLHQSGVNVTIITRSKGEISGKDPKTAFNHIHDAFQQNHRGNDLVHSRILICDDNIALVSSADLTQDSLLGQFNAGLIISDPSIIHKLNDYFNQVWKKSNKI